MKRILAVALVLAMLCSSVNVPVFAAEEATGKTGDVIEVSIPELVSFGTVETSAIPTATRSLSDGIVKLKDGTAVQWIDRLDLAEEEQFVKELYDTLVEASDNDGVNDYLIEDRYFSSDYAIDVVTIKGALDGEYEKSEVSTVVNEVITDTFQKCAPFVHSAYGAFDRDHPEVFWLSGETKAKASVSYNLVSAGGSKYKVNYELKVRFVLKADDFDIREEKYRSEGAIKGKISQVNTRVTELINPVSGKTAEEQITYFNEQLTKTNQYNTSANLSNIDQNCRECIAALFGSVGTQGPVCESYARAFKVLCDAAEIPCVLVDGLAKNYIGDEGGEHMWNYAQVNGQWYGVDVTWNDPMGGANAAVSGYENEQWLLVYENSVIRDMTFIESHPVSNRATTKGAAFTNGPELAKLVENNNIFYVSDYGQDTNSGKQEQPLKTLQKALELSEHGAVIHILDDIEIADDTNNDAPLMIDKNVTIIGNEETLPTMSLRAGGMILGADVTIQDVAIGTEGFLRPGIAANGHTLKLVNVQQNERNLRPLQIYGGTFFEFSSEGYGKGLDYGAAVRGLESRVIIEGGSCDAIYAGSTNGSVNLPVNISISKGNDISIEKGIYAGSTVKDPGNTAMAGQIPVLEERIELSGSVNIDLQDFNHGGRVIDGVNENHKVNLSASNTGMYSFIIKNLDSLKINHGTFVPAKGSIFGIDGNVPDLELAGSSDNKATIDLSGYIPADSAEKEVVFTVNDFTGTENAILILASEGLLNINGILSGTNIEFRASGSGVSAEYWRSEEYPGGSGWIEPETKYINSAKGDGNFVIANPYFTQEGIAFTEESSALTGWKTVGDEISMKDFGIDSKEVLFEEFHWYGYCELDMNAVFSEGSVEDLGKIPFEYQVVYTDCTGRITEYLQQSSVGDEDGYYACDYKISPDSDEILLNFEPASWEDVDENEQIYVKHVLYVNQGSGELPIGTYQISMTAETSEGTVTKTATLTIASEEAEVTPTPTETEEPTPTETEEPTPTETEEPTPTETEEPTPTETEEPTPTETEEPTPTETEEPTPMETEEPTPTETEEPTPTETEEPTLTETEEPTPTETEAPMPTETEEPAPTETEVPEVKDEVTSIFSDVYDDWYKDYVQYVYDNGLMTGLSGTTKFAPDANITKAQVAQVLYNMEEQPEAADKKVFTDLKDVYESEWYANAVAWAYNTGVVTGDTNAKKFFPNADVTREQLAIMMYRYAKYKGMNTSASSNLVGLKSAENVSNWALDGVKWAVGSGLISGVDKNGVKDLQPQGNASRAQMAAILQRFCEGYGL